ncbi:hypothetical protein [Anaeromicrobium sediminis]|uniref:hypothetical protein n=1 Tax=Anaeromicrobium sediminis TaxID=1478221 RepID=UPI00159599EC|nr:hypothetical protein [Anaeromicrobium sediminis]
MSKIKFKIILYLIISMLVQYLYGKTLGVSGGGIGVLVFGLFDMLDKDFSIIRLNKEE